MPRNRTRALAVTAALAVPLAVGLPAASAAPTTLRATLSGAKEVPKAGNGRGTARLTLDPAKGQVCFNIKLKRVGTTVAGHIHKGRSGKAGDVFIALFAKPTKHPKGCASAPAREIRDVLEHPSRYYVNVHTAKFQAGAARGQLHR